jgi:glutaredoxin
MEIKYYIFTMYGCEYCQNLLNELNTLGIQYIDVKTDDHPDIWFQLAVQTQNEALPVLVIRDGISDFGKPFIPVKDFDTIDELIEIILNDIGTTNI